MGGSAGAVARHVGGLAAVCPLCRGARVLGGASTAGWRHWAEDAGGAVGRRGGVGARVQAQAALAGRVGRRVSAAERAHGEAAAALERTVEALRSAQTALLGEVGALRADNKALRSEVATLRGELSAQHDKLAELRRTVQELLAAGGWVRAGIVM